MLPLFSCAQVRFGNTKTCPNGGHAPACGCFECAGRTQGPRFHLGASLVHVACRTARQVNVFAVLRLCLAVANRCCIWVCEVHWYLHVTCNDLACTGPRLSEGLRRTRTPPSASLLLCLEALASHLPRVTAMLPLFSCANVRFGNTKTCPGGGHARQMRCQGLKTEQQGCARRCPGAPQPFRQSGACARQVIASHMQIPVHFTHPNTAAICHCKTQPQHGEDIHLHGCAAGNMDQ